MTNDQDLSGHTALVTGGARRLGKAFAEALASRGANILVHHGHSPEEAETVVQSARALGVEAIALEANLADQEQAATLIEKVLETFPDVDMLVNNAAIFEPVGPLEATNEEWQRHLDINLTAPYLISRGFANARDGRAGSIVNLLDWRALRPGADHFPYTISKAALAALTRGLAVAFAPKIRVNGLALGAILPPTDGGSGDPLEAVPAARWGRVDESVEALLFLLAGSDYVTGEILHVDGGRHLV